MEKSCSMDIKSVIQDELVLEISQHRAYGVQYCYYALFVKRVDLILNDLHTHTHTHSH